MGEDIRGRQGGGAGGNWPVAETWRAWRTHGRSRTIAFINARNLQVGALLRTDVCIVGAGPAGITLALDLAQRGREVLLLESGGLTPARETQSLLASDSGDSPIPPLDDRITSYNVCYTKLLRIHDFPPIY